VAVLTVGERRRAVSFAALVDGILGVLAGAILFAMMSLTFVDVVGRYVFSKPVPGGFEITELLMAGLIFTGLPLVTAKEQHVTIDMLDPLIPEAWRVWQRRAVNLACAVCVGAVAWRLWVKAGQTAAYGDTTATLLLPLAPIAYAMAALTTVTAAILLLKAVRPAPAGPDSRV
jgi:TRAP-type transport system small permease protein